MSKSQSRDSARTIPWWAWLTIGTISVAAWLVIQHAGRGTAPFFDEWDFITARRGLSAETLLSGHNGHFSAVPVLIYKVLLQLVGLDHYWVFRAVLATLVVLTALLVFRFAALRSSPVIGVFAGTLALTLGSGAQDLLWAFQIGFTLSVCSGVAMLSALASRSRLGPWVAGIALTISLASSGIGLVFLATALVFAVLSRRRDQLVAVAVPTLIYGLWYLGYGESTLQPGNIALAVPYAANMAAAGLGGIAGLGLDFGRALLVVGVVATAWAVARRKRIGPVLTALLAAPIVFWGLTALSRAHLGEPDAPRYVYVSAILLILLAVELTGRYEFPRRGLLLGAGLVSLAALANLGPLNANGAVLRHNAQVLRAQVAALDLARAGGLEVDRGFKPAPDVAPQIFTGTFEDAEAEFGQLVPNPTKTLATAPDQALVAADQTLVNAGTVTTTAQAASAAGKLTCGRPVPAAASELTLRPGQTAQFKIATDAALALRRFGSTFPTDGLRPLPAGLITARAVQDGNPKPWHLQIAHGTSVATCR